MFNFEDDFSISKSLCVTLCQTPLPLWLKPRRFTEYGTELHGGYAYIYGSISTHEKIVLRSLIYFVFFFRPTNTEATLAWKKLDGHHR